MAIKEKSKVQIKIDAKMIVFTCFGVLCFLFYYCTIVIDKVGVFGDFMAHGRFAIGELELAIYYPLYHIVFKILYFLFY